jgi:hypothetical protein
MGYPSMDVDQCVRATKDSRLRDRISDVMHRCGSLAFSLAPSLSFSSFKAISQAADVCFFSLALVASATSCAPTLATALLRWMLMYVTSCAVLSPSCHLHPVCPVFFSCYAISLMLFSQDDDYGKFTEMASNTPGALLAPGSSTGGQVYQSPSVYAAASNSNGATFSNPVPGSTYQPPPGRDRSLLLSLRWLSLSFCLFAV